MNGFGGRDIASAFVVGDGADQGHDVGIGPERYGRRPRWGQGQDHAGFENIAQNPPGPSLRPHQDAQADWGRYSAFHITAMVSVDPCTLENGCLEVVAGHHDRGLIGDLWKPLSDEQMRGMDFIAVPTAPGDAIFFDSFAPHRSARNATALPRRVLYITYNRASEGDWRVQYYADKRKSFPPDCEREPGTVYEYKV